MIKNEIFEIYEHSFFPLTSQQTIVNYNLIDSHHFYQLLNFAFQESHFVKRRDKF